MRRKFGLTAGELRELGAIRITAALRRDLLSHAVTAASEVCGPLYGGVVSLVPGGGLVLDVQSWRPVVNAAASGGCFAMPVAEFLGAAAGPAQPGGPGGPRLVGLFHSHPRGDATPSDLDSIGIARLPFVWAIAGTCGSDTAELRFFAWSAAGVREVAEVTEVAGC